MKGDRHRGEIDRSKNPRLKGNRARQWLRRTMRERALQRRIRTGLNEPAINLILANEDGRIEKFDACIMTPIDTIGTLLYIRDSIIISGVSFRATVSIR